MKHTPLLSAPASETLRRWSFGIPHLAFFIVILSFGIRHSAPAAIVYSGLQNILIPTTFAGVFIDLDNAATSGSAFTGWDINPFYGGAGIANSPSFQAARTGTGNVDAMIRLNSGDLIGSILNYSTGFGGSGSPNAHLGGGVSQFGVGSEGYLGFKLTLNDTNGPYYGWMRLTLTNNTAGGVIKDWAYEDTGASIQAGVVPEPSKAMLLFIGLASASMRRKRSRQTL